MFGKRAASTPGPDDSRQRALEAENAELRRTIAAVYPVLADNDDLRVRLGVANLSNQLLQAELRRVCELHQHHPREHAAFLVRLAHEERATAVRLRRRSA